jgi:thiol-disulfide isomerase/thioredoxin
LILSLLYFGLFFQLGASPSDSSCALSPTLNELENRNRQELRLNDLAIDRTALQGFAVWEQESQQLRPRKPGENMDDSTPVIILHLWAVWCSPCREEFPVWRELKEKLAKQYGGNVRIAHIAMQNEPGQMASFVSEMGKKLPFGAKYFDRDGRLAKNLRPALGNKKDPPLPMTLWLDHERIVRHAIVGPITKRLPQVMELTAQLVRIIQQQQSGALRPKPTEDENDVFSPQ